MTFIAANSSVILKLPSGRLKQVEIVPGRSVSLGKFGSFKSDDVIGMPYGFTYEIGDGSRLQLVMDRTLSELEETDATNENIHDDGSAQKLTYVDIQALKQAGVTGRELIQRQLAGSESYDQRTVYSQAKYVARKEQKHLRLFTPLTPDLGTLCTYHFDKNPEKIRWMRFDALAQLLSFASVRPGGRYLVVDGVGGLLTGALLERLAGEGTVLAINDAESPPAFDILSQFNLPEQCKRVLKVLHWAALEADYRPVFSEQDTGQGQGQGQGRDKSRNRKRQATIREVERNRADVARGEFDALLVACHYEPMSIIRRLRSALGGSASVVVHSPYLQPLAEAHAQLRADDAFINVSLTEPWLRRYQVLPGRTHPEMMTSATAGFILHALRVWTHEEALQIKNKHEAELEAAAAAAANKRPRLDEPEPEPEPEADGGTTTELVS